MLLEVVTPVPATGLFSMSWLVIAIPALSAAVLLLVGRAGDRWGHILGTLAPLVSFALGLSLFADLLAAEEAERAVAVPLYDWISIGQWNIDAGLLVDQLSIVFVLLITGVGSLIHIYSIGYMAHDERRRRFFAFLNLFVAAMLLLVLADDYLVLFVGWEGVGLASYLLIGFWQHKPTAATAAKKAFVVNRVGDLGHVHRDHADAGHLRLVGLRHRQRRACRRSAPRWPRSWACCCSSAPAASPPRCRCSPGCWTRWRARPRSRR